MKLRHKFGVLALIYVASLSANLIMSGWCIVAYFQSAFVDVQSTFVRQAQIERLRIQLEGLRERMDLAGSADHQGVAYRLQEIADEVQGLRQEWSGQVAPVWRQLQDALASAVSAPDIAALERCDHLLGMASALITGIRQVQIDAAAATQQKVVAILIGNAACGALLCLVGLVLVRRWVLQPVADLRAATQAIGQGDFAFRVTPRSADELGRLAEEVNHMAGTIVAMQARLVAQERQAAAGEIFQRIAHNIRNPLAGIRGLAEATCREDLPGERIMEYQQRIVLSIDQLEKWLRDLQHSVAPMTLNPQVTDLAELVEGVRHVLAPMADRNGVAIVVQVDAQARYVTLDGFHFEQALVALITNAVQASRRGQAVRVRVAPVPDTLDQWCVSVEDDGEGIPQELRSKIFLPNFTTRRDGNGIGLAMAAKVVHTHGGRITVSSSPGAGCRFDAILPGRASAQSAC